MNMLVFWLGLATILFAYMTLWFGVAVWSKRYDVVDTAWGLGFVLVAWVSLGLQERVGAAQIVSALLVSIWGLRLSAHIANRNWRKHTDDHRYQTMQAAWKQHKNLRAYINIFLLQGILVVLVSSPMIAIAVATGSHISAGVLIGWLVWGFGICFEAIADYQLARFLRRRPATSHAVMSSGLWRYSRHPNYFGEITAWWGAAIVAASVGEWWGILGAVTITILITKISGIPPIEQHYAGRVDYADYAKRTSVLVPLPPKNNS